MKTKFERKNHVIKNLEENSSQKYDSIALAKKESHKLQIANGGLGIGSLKVIK